MCAGSEFDVRGSEHAEYVLRKMGRFPSNHMSCILPPFKMVSESHEAPTGSHTSEDGTFFFFYRTVGRVHVARGSVYDF
jgi:hypothetical protein